MLHLSWMKWGNILVDTYRDPYVASKILNGAVLYKDICYEMGAAYALFIGRYRQNIRYRYLYLCRLRNRFDIIDGSFDIQDIPYFSQPSALCGNSFNFLTVFAIREYHYNDVCNLSFLIALPR